MFFVPFAPFKFRARGFLNLKQKNKFKKRTQRTTLTEFILAPAIDTRNNNSSKREELMESVGGGSISNNRNNNNKRGLYLIYVR